jgi:hypothetical protein
LIAGVTGFWWNFSPQVKTGLTTAWFDTTPLDGGAVSGSRRPDEIVLAATKATQLAAAAVGVANPKQILWGDTHVHTTYSTDAFSMSMPYLHGSRGAYPPAFACDYARFVSGLDFYALTDHAESYTPGIWADQVNSVRQCNALAGSPENPDLVAFIGWEWSQAGHGPEDHYGHHNVFFKDAEKGKIPSRPIGASGLSSAGLRPRPWSRPVWLLDPVNAGYYHSRVAFLERMAATPDCATGVPSNELPANCYEKAATPAELYAKLDDWGFEAMVIPHGTTWGLYTPQEASWKHYMSNPDNLDLGRGTLIEIYSGHGNSGPYSEFDVVGRDEDGNIFCPEPRDNYLPNCWQAGIIARDRCLSEGQDAASCDALMMQARDRYAAEPGPDANAILKGDNVADWLDAGQARDVYLPSFNYRNRKSIQYGLALRNSQAPEGKQRFRWGFAGSTDTHSARAGHGFKQLMRSSASDSRGAVNEQWRKLLNPTVNEEKISTLRTIEEMNSLSGRRLETERQTSFFTLGGIVAVHATGRDRNSIWDAMRRREVYATTGHRLLVWFDLLDGEESLPMGSITARHDAPAFRVKAVGSFKQLPGCPEYVKEALEARHLEKMADGECYHPSNERYVIRAIEIVRIRPQNHAGEDPASLIEDRWKTFDCAPDPAGCVVEFTDSDFTRGSRDTVYYARVIEEVSDLVNGHNLRTTFDENGKAIKTDPCYGDYRTPEEDNCLAPVGHRAWSSPIFVDYEAMDQKVARKEH